MEYIENALTVEIYNNLRKSVNWGLFSERQNKKALENGLVSVVAFNEKEAVGMARVIGDGVYHLIVDVVVKPEFQGQGIGTELINRVLNYIEEGLEQGERTSVQLISEAGKECFYESFGFKKIPNEYAGYGMRKVLWGEKE